MSPTVPPRVSDSDVVDLKVMVGRIEERLKLVERVIYGMAALVLVAVATALIQLVVDPN